MSKTYNINLSDQERKLMEVWDKQDPIDEWEIEKNKRINKIKGLLMQDFQGEVIGFVIVSIVVIMLGLYEAKVRERNK